MVEKYHLYKDNPQVKISEPWKDILEKLVGIMPVGEEEKAEEGACAFYPRCSFSNRRCLIEVPVLKKYEK